MWNQLVFHFVFHICVRFYATSIKSFSNSSAIDCWWGYWSAGVCGAQPDFRRMRASRRHRRSSRKEIFSRCCGRALISSWPCKRLHIFIACFDFSDFVKTTLQIICAVAINFAAVPLCPPILFSKTHRGLCTMYPTEHHPRWHKTWESSPQWRRFCQNMWFRC